MLFHPYLLLLKELLRKLELNRIENDVQFMLMPGTKEYYKEQHFQ